MAVTEASFSCESGEVQGLIGENGAGKSTMMKIVAGIYGADSGGVKIRGEEVSYRNPWQAVEKGVVLVHQELSLVPDLTVAENLFLPKPPTGKFNLVSQRDLEKRAKGFFADLGLEGVPPGSRVNNLPLRSRQTVEIAKALFRKRKILVLDEPTSALSLEDVKWLSGILERLRQEDMTVIYISHRMGEIKDLCDRFTILRNGKEVGTFPAHSIHDKEVISLMIGRSLEATFPPKPAYRDDLPSAIEVENLHSDSGLSGVDFVLRKGEVLGLAGLEGQGQRALFQSLFGMDRLSEGKIVVNGKPVRIRHPKEAIHAGMSFAIGLVPEDRSTEGLFLDLPIRQNVTLPVLDTLTVLGWVKRKQEYSRVVDLFKKINIRLNVIDEFANSLSGGNQQKVVIAKWLLAASQNLLMYDPTRGVDVGTKFEIYSLIRDWANSGKSILFYSTELPELVGLCDRVLTIYGGRIVAEFRGEEITEEKLLAAMVGMNSEKQHTTKARAEKEAR
jgi:ribose transport system ATP-binding protein